MKRLCIICEGQTEGEFVERLLAPHLWKKSKISAHPSLLKTRAGQRGGGNVSVPRLGKHISREYHKSDFITTLVDYYGFKDVNGRSKKQLEHDILDEAQTLIRQRFDPRYVLPYVQMHEFEALLFSDISKFELLSDNWNNESQTRLQQIYDDFETPEDINNSAQTAPSKRLDAIFPGYSNNSKIPDGPLIAKDIGLAKIRQECPLFNNWIGQLEKL